MKKARRITAMVMALAMMTSVMAIATGCQKSEPAASQAAPASSQEAAVSSEAPAAPEGKTLNIWVWNDEFQSRFNDYYPEVKEVAKDKSTTTLKDGTIVKWTINPNDNNNYQNKLDQALLAQDSAAADDKIDIFLVEADYALKYVNSDYTLDVKRILDCLTAI